MFTMAKAKFGEGERTVEVLVVGNTVYVDDDFCAKAFPGDHVQVVAANEARRDGSSLHASWKELLQHLDQAYEFDRVVYLSTYLTPLDYRLYPNTSHTVSYTHLTLPTKLEV